MQPKCQSDRKEAGHCVSVGQYGGIAGGAGSTVLGVLAFLSYNLLSSGMCDRALQERPRPLCW